jgi:hypothetical protein
MEPRLVDETLRLGCWLLLDLLVERVLLKLQEHKRAYQTKFADKLVIAVGGRRHGCL